MRRSHGKERAFAFLAALGAMVIAFLIVFAMSAAIDFSLNTIGRTRTQLQAEAAIESAVDYAMSWVGSVTYRGTEQWVEIETDHLNQRLLRVRIAVEPLSADHPAYRSPSLAYRSGDVLVRVQADAAQERSVVGERQVLGNTEGRRDRPIDLTATLRAVAAE
jgi:hypothetical protein